MSFLAHIRNLLPSFKKNAVLESIEQTSHAIRETSLPVTQQAGEFFTSHAATSKEAKAMLAEFSKSINYERGANPVAQVSKILGNALLILDGIAAESKTVFSEVEANIALTYAKSTYLRLIQAAEYASTYSIKWVNYLLVLETAEQDSSTPVRKQLVPAEIQWIKGGFNDFLLCLAALAKAPAEIKKIVDGLPDAVISELSEATLTNTVGLNKLDPMNMRNFSTRVNPFYLWGLHKAEQQARAYKSKKEEVEMLQLRLLNLQKLRDKTPDARLQKEIDYMAARVSKSTYQLQQMEEEWLNG